jgi:HK97 gp10 family phage protein
MSDLVAIDGAADLDRLLAMLPAEIARKNVDAALYAGARVVAVAMKSTCPAGAEAHVYRHRKKGMFTGAESMRPAGFGKSQIRARKARPGEYGEIGAIVGDANISAAAVAGVGSKAFYLKFVEWGWVLTSHGKGRAARRRIKHVPPRPFLRPAWEMSKMAALNVIGRTLGAGIEKSAARLAGPYIKSGFSARTRTFIGR